MPSPFEAAGAARDASKSAPLHTGRFFTGLWTQRSPLRDAATPYLYEKFYSASRYDSLIGGQNTEISARLTLARRPGSSVYVDNLGGQPLPVIDRMYEWRSYINGQERIRVVGDTAASVIELTAGTAGRNGALLTKQPGAGSSYFQSVGNAMYWADGVEAKKCFATPLGWAPNKTIPPNTYIVGYNGYLQYTFYGGVTGGGWEPTWPIQKGILTQDGSVLWAGSIHQVMNWGIAAPPGAPSLSQTSTNASTSGQRWVPNAFWNAAQAVNDNTTGTVQVLVTGGVTAATAPAFSSNAGAITQDGAAQWKCAGTGAWAANRHQAAGDIVIATPTSTAFGGGGGSVYMKCSTAGVTGVATPAWSLGTGSITQDGSVVWQNAGTIFSAQSSLVRGRNNTTLTTIADSKGGYQAILETGQGGITEPNWNETLGATTSDNLWAAGVTPFYDTLWISSTAPANVTAPWSYAYAYRNSITGHVSTASIISGQIVPTQGYFVALSGLGSPDTQVDTIRIYRTSQGGGILLFLADIPAPPPGASWSYYDNADDAALNPLIEAQIANSNDPPPPTLAGTSYYLGRIWGFDGNVLRYSGGPDTLSGVGNEAWPPLNSFTFPSTGVRTWPTAIGLIVFTQSDVYIIQGQGTAASPFYANIFQQGVGLLNYDSFAVNGSTAYMMTTALRCISFDPGAGETEVGFPIGDLFAANYTAAGTRMEYHEGSSADTALYVADGAVGWYRLSTINAPESGQIWSPQARFASGIAALASIEIAPGVKRLLYTLQAGGPVLMRDDTTYADNGVAYPAAAVIGSIVLAQPGEIAALQFITLDSIAVGTQAAVGILFNEIAGTFTNYTASHPDPTSLRPSKTISGQRYYMTQNGNPPWCRHMQVQLSWPVENQANELLAYTMFGFLKADIAEK